MFLSTSISLLSLMAITASAAPADTKKPTSSMDYGRGFPRGWASASDYLIQDNQNNQRALTGQFEGGFAVVGSPAECATFCNKNGWPLAGVEYGGECFCGSELKNGGSLNTLNYRDAMKCKGTNLNCGAPDGLNLFYNTQVLWKNWYGGFNLYQNPIYQNNGFQPTGLCLKETGDGAARLFNGPSLKTDDMTSAKCTDFCKSKGFKQAGLEYGRECYCSNDVNLWSAKRADNCNLTCKGRRTEICGGHDALTVYTQPRGRPQQKIAVGGDESAEPVDGAAEDPVKEVTIVN